MSQVHIVNVLAEIDVTRDFSPGYGGLAAGLPQGQGGRLDNVSGGSPPEQDLISGERPRNKASQGGIRVCPLLDTIARPIFFVLCFLNQ